MFRHTYFILSILLPLTGALIFSRLGLWTLLLALCLWPYLAFITNRQEKHDQKVAISQSPQAANAKARLKKYSQAYQKREFIGIIHSIVRCFCAIPWLLCWLVIGLWCVEPSLFLVQITLIYNEISHPEHSHLMLFAMSALSASAGPLLWEFDSHTLKKLSLSKNQNKPNKD